jgi:hypothetical protein
VRNIDFARDSGPVRAFTVTTAALYASASTDQPKATEHLRFTYSPHTTKQHSGSIWPGFGSEQPVIPLMTSHLYRKYSYTSSPHLAYYRVALVFYLSTTIWFIFIFYFRAPEWAWFSDGTFQDFMYLTGEMHFMEVIHVSHLFLLSGQFECYLSPKLVKIILGNQ